MPPLAAYVLRRLAVGVILVFLVSLLVFAATQALGDPASSILGRTATPEAKEAFRERLGLDRPVHQQYWDWLSGFVVGDFGESLATGRPVSEYLGPRMSNTLALAAATLLVMIPLAIVLGVWSGVRKNGLVDRAVASFSLGAIAIPEFVIGTLLALVVAVQLGLVPPNSLVPPGDNPLTHPDLLALPVVTLTLVGLAYIVRILRAGVIEVMESEYVQMARLNGLPERRVVWGHGLRNASATTVQVIAQTVMWLVSGVVIVEVVFAYPGFGQAVITAVSQRDITVVQAAVLLVAAIYIVINIVADVIVVLLVPKLRTAQ
jgi:peptide/nickel transport system permease protein